MLRYTLLPVLLLSLLLGGCGEHCEPVPVSYCAEYEQPDTLVMEGWWAGEYDVSFHYLIFSNSVSMSWHEDRYDMRVQRDGFWREPFYRTSSFVGGGWLEPGQQKFGAEYSPWENWVFIGNYMASQQDMHFRGRVLVEGDDRGNFSMSRPRYCVRKAEYEKLVCTDVYVAPVIMAKPEDPVEDFQMASATLSPNPVTADATLAIEAAVTPEGDHAWTVSMSPATAPAQVLATWVHQGTSFSQTVTAPSEAGDYSVRFQVARDTDAEDLIDMAVALAVTPGAQ